MVMVSQPFLAISICNRTFHYCFCIFSLHCCCNVYGNLRNVFTRAFKIKRLVGFTLSVQTWVKCTTTGFQPFHLTLFLLPKIMKPLNSVRGRWSLMCYAFKNGNFLFTKQIWWEQTIIYYFFWRKIHLHSILLSISLKIEIEIGIREESIHSKTYYAIQKTDFFFATQIFIFYFIVKITIAFNISFLKI